MFIREFFGEKLEGFLNQTFFVFESVHVNLLVVIFTMENINK